MEPLPSKKNVWPLTRLYVLGHDLDDRDYRGFAIAMGHLVARGAACELLRGDAERKLRLAVSKHGG